MYFNWWFCRFEGHKEFIKKWIFINVWIHFFVALCSIKKGKVVNRRSSIIVCCIYKFIIREYLYIIKDKSILSMFLFFVTIILNGGYIIYCMDRLQTISNGVGGWCDFSHYTGEGNGIFWVVMILGPVSCGRCLCIFMKYFMKRGQMKLFVLSTCIHLQAFNHGSLIHWYVHKNCIFESYNIWILDYTYWNACQVWGNGLYFYMQCG